MSRLKANVPPEYLDSPYEREDEPLSRKNLADRVCALYTNLEHGSVAVLNGRWGAGKTTFAKKLTSHLSVNNIACTYFDAFSKDFSESPFLALSSHLVNQIDKRGNSSLPAATDIRRASRTVSRKLATVTARIAIKAATLGLVGGSEIDALSEVAEDLGKEGSDAGEFIAGKLFDEFLEIETDFDAFRSTLDGLPKALQPSAAEEQKDKVVFIIDELDRCRPDFALGIIEVIKHFFDHEKIHFLLVTNLDYLISSVNAKYGLGKDSKEYLEKFYDFVIFFEEEEWDRSRHPAASLVSQRFELLMSGHSGREAHDLNESLQAFAKAFDLSLRQASALVTNATLSYLSYNERVFRPSVLIALLSLYRTRFPEIYQDIKKGSYTAGQLLSVFDDIQFDDEFYNDRLKNIVAFYASKDGEIDRSDECYQGYGNMTARYNFRSYRDVFPMLANSVIDNFGTP